jgi:hypothetical protein
VFYGMEEYFQGPSVAHVPSVLTALLYMNMFHGMEEYFQGPSVAHVPPVLTALLYMNTFRPASNNYIYEICVLIEVGRYCHLGSGSVQFADCIPVFLRDLLPTD